MAGMIKTDVVGLKTLYDTFKDDVQRADDIRKPTDSALDNAVWESTNATAFRETWALFKPQPITFEHTFTIDVANNYNDNVKSGGENLDLLPAVEAIA